MNIPEIIIILAALGTENHGLSNTWLLRGLAFISGPVKDTHVEYKILDRTPLGSKSKGSGDFKELSYCTS